MSEIRDRQVNFQHNYNRIVIEVETLAHTKLAASIAASRISCAPLPLETNLADTLTLSRPSAKAVYEDDSPSNLLIARVTVQYHSSSTAAAQSAACHTVLDLLTDLCTAEADRAEAQFDELDAQVLTPMLAQYAQLRREIAALRQSK